VWSSDAQVNARLNQNHSSPTRSRNRQLERIHLPGVQTTPQRIGLMIAASLTAAFSFLTPAATGAGDRDFGVR
jgi:hypothetical protein